jgi:hypothetical protein
VLVRQRLRRENVPQNNSPSPRRPFEVCNIPLFDPKNELHQSIAELARNARKELLKVVPKMQTPVATARADARRIVANQLHNLDKLVVKLLNGNSTKYPTHKSEPMQLMELFEEKS